MLIGELEGGYTSKYIVLFSQFFCMFENVSSKHGGRREKLARRPQEMPKSYPQTRDIIFSLLHKVPKENVYTGNNDKGR